MKVNSITQNYYCNSAKPNCTPQFKGEYLKDFDGYRLKYTNLYKYVSELRKNEINDFFERYLSPGVNVYPESPTCNNTKLYYIPWKADLLYNSIRLTEIPERIYADINYYITNAKAIEDDVLDMTFSYFKEYVNNFDFNKRWWRIDHVNRINYLDTKYLKQQYAYINEHPDRLPTTYKAKLDLFQNFVDSFEFQKVYKSLKSSIK